MRFPWKSFLPLSVHIGKFLSMLCWKLARPSWIFGTILEYGQWCRSEISFAFDNIHLFNVWFWTLKNIINVIFVFFNVYFTYRSASCLNIFNEFIRYIVYTIFKVKIISFIVETKRSYYIIINEYDHDFSRTNLDFILSSLLLLKSLKSYFKVVLLPS